MGWNYDVSLKRVNEHLKNMGEIEVESLDREMDLENLSETKCRQIFGAHIYAEFRNLSTLINTMTAKTDRQRVIQATHVYQREVARIVDAVGGVRIVFQGGRAHALIYRPIRNATKIATKAALLQLVLDRFGVIFSEEFVTLPDLFMRSGADMGESIGTRNGTQGDRELLFLGAPANHAAKLLPAGADRRLTSTVKDALAVDVAAYVEADPEGEWRLNRPSTEDLAALLKKHGVDWNADDCLDRLQQDRKDFPATKADLSGAEVKIDFDALSFFNNKLVEAATVYADVSGFTACIDSATTTKARAAALRAFHAIRKEMAVVVRDDFNGIRVQFQGDRVQALFHLPEDDADGFSEKAVRAAVGLQSSFEQVLKPLLPDIGSLGLGIGASQGTTVATKLGERGHRDRICLGTDVLRAERNEENVDKREIGISKNVLDHLPTELSQYFKWSDTTDCYVATGLDQKKLDLAEAARDMNAGKSVYVRPAAVGTVISTRPGEGRERRPSPSHAA